MHTGSGVVNNYTQLIKLITQLTYCDNSALQIAHIRHKCFSHILVQVIFGTLVQSLIQTRSCQNYSSESLELLPVSFSRNR